MMRNTIAHQRKKGYQLAETNKLHGSLATSNCSWMFKILPLMINAYIFFYYILGIKLSLIVSLSNVPIRGKKILDVFCFTFFALHLFTLLSELRYVHPQLLRENGYRFIFPSIRNILLSSASLFHRNLKISISSKSYTSILNILIFPNA